MKNALIRPMAGMPKYAAGFVATLMFRLITPLLGMWNISPLMATQYAGSKAYGPVVGGLYGALSMIALDAIVGKIGSWTILTAITYGLVGIGGGYFFRNRKATATHFVMASIVGTLFFDLITGVMAGPLLYDQSWSAALIGQVPFTIRHLAGNLFFAVALAPWFYHAIMSNPSWEFPLLRQKTA